MTPSTASQPQPPVQVAGDDRGSIPLALLAVIALSAIMGALAATAIGSTRAARFDRSYTEVVQIADAGAQEGESRLIRALDPDVLEAVVVPAGCAPATPTTCPVVDSHTDTLDGIEYTWETRKVANLRYQVRSVATTADGVQRSVVVDLVDLPRFFIAAFSDQGLVMTGSNGASSYGATGWGTGNGIVASNESIHLNGASTGVDAVHLYNWRDNANLGRCTHTGGNDCDYVKTLPEARLPSARIDDKLVVGSDQLPTDFIDDQRALCPANLPDYTASTYQSGNGRLGSAGTETTLCFQDVTFDRNVTVLGTVHIYVYGNLQFTNHIEVNCGAGCTPGGSTPDARALSFYVDGPDNPATDPPTSVVIGNNTDVVAGIYAPESTCSGDNPNSGGSNAGSAVYGSMICQTISNQGGWSFHYDDRLRDVGTGVYTREAWREEVVP